MEKQTRLVVYSAQAVKDIADIYEYGAEAFSPSSAELFIQELLKTTDELTTTYLLHTECRFLPTRSRKYRMMIFYSYLVIYRITELRIEVLTIIHSSRSINAIKQARKIML